MKIPVLILALSLFVCSFITTAHAQTITTIAGVYDANTYNGDTIAATAVHLASPDNVILDGAGNYYISDTYHHRIRKVDAAGIITTIAGTGTTMGGGYSGDGGPATAAQLNTPLGMAFDHAGNLYIADNFNNRIRKINTDGIITTIAGTDSAGYNGDNIPATAAWLNSPHYIALDATENLYICDYGNHRIRKIDGSGIITTIAGTGASTGVPGDGGAATAAIIPSPYGIVIDAGGNIYFTDYLGDRVRKINISGIITTIAGNGHSNYNGDNIPATDAWLFNPCGITLDNDGNLCIADGNNCRIRKVDHSGIITTLAGNGPIDYSGDGGMATAAGLGSITGLAINSSGDLYIAGFGYDVIRLVRHAVNAVSVKPVSSNESNVILYPNPNSGEFALKVDAATNESFELIIGDITGRIVYQAKGMTNSEMQLTLSGPKGIYFVTIRMQYGGDVTKKMIIE